MAHNAGVEVAVWQRGRVIATRLVPNDALSTSAGTFAFALTDGELFSLQDVDTYPVTLTLAWGDDTLAVPGVEVDELVMNVLPLPTAPVVGEPIGSGSAFLVLDGTGAGTVFVVGTGTPAIVLDVNSTGAVAVVGTGTASLIIDVSGTGSVAASGRVGTGTAAIGVDVTAAGTITWPVRTGTGAALLTVVASGAGVVTTTSVLVPDSTVSQTNWAITGAATIHAALAAGDADYIQANIANANCRVTLSNPSVGYASLAGVTLRVRVQKP